MARTAGIALPVAAMRIAKTLAWSALGLAIACAAAELIAGPGYRLGWWSYGAGIQVVRWSATIGIAAILLALAALVAAGRYAVRQARIAGAIGLALGVLVVAPPAYLFWMVGRVPRIHDISTDTGNPPRFVAVLPLRKGLNPTEVDSHVLEQQKKGYPDLAPARLELPAPQAFQRAERAVRAMGWELVAVAPEELRIEATDTTWLFGFKDDVVIRVTPEGGASRVDVRSSSRVGLSDLGANASRIRAFLKKLATA